MIPAWLIADLPMLARELAKRPDMTHTFEPPDAVCDPIPADCADEVKARLEALLPPELLARYDGLFVAPELTKGHRVMIWLAPRPTPPRALGEA